MFTRFDNDAVNVGAVLAVIIGAIILGPATRELRMLRVTLRGARTTGRIEAVREARRDRYGDAVRWTSTVAYWAEADGKRHEVRFDERLGYPHERKEEIAVRYNPRNPQRFVTIRSPKEVLAKAGGLAAVGVIFIASGLWWFYGAH